jgi:hypothetical protein
MKKIELFFTSILILVLLLKAFNVAHCSEILTLTLFSLSPIYMITAYFLFKESKHYAAISIISGFLFANTFHGILFKIQSWAYANELLIISFIGLTVLFLVVFLLYIFKEKTTAFARNNDVNNVLLDVENTYIDTTAKLYCQNMMIRLGLVLALISGLLLCQENTIFDFCHREDPELIRLHTAWTNNPDDVAAKESFIEYKKLD